MAALTEWNNFYVILGTAAATLIGLQFVAVTIMSNTPVRAGMAEASKSFLTPTTVHFSCVLLLALLAAIPWHTSLGPAIVWAIIALAGLYYGMRVKQSMSSIDIYEPEFEDWLFHILLPMGSYVLILAGAVTAVLGYNIAYFAIAAACLFLLFSAVHNAWDGLVYFIFSSQMRRDALESMNRPVAEKSVEQH